MEVLVLFIDDQHKKTTWQTGRITCLRHDRLDSFDAVFAGDKTERRLSFLFTRVLDPTGGTVTEVSTI